MSTQYSGKQVIKAGEALIDAEAMAASPDKFSKAMDVMSYWRFSHEVPLENAFSLLQEIAIKQDKKSIFAKRLKRHVSIVRKLIRFKKMKLKNMQDIGGCRVILTSRKKLMHTVRQLRKRPEFKNTQGKIRYKDYIKSPKDDGYRSYHLIGEFPDATGNTKNIEIQLRTEIQHYWATALEIVDLFTDQALKSNQGDEAWKTFFINVSEQFSIMEEVHLFDTLSHESKNQAYKNILDKKKHLLQSCKTAQDYTKHLDVFERLNSFSGSLKVIGEQLEGASDSSGYSLLKIDIKKHTLESAIFSNEDSKLAEEEYIKAEKEASSKTTVAVALVSSNAVGDIRAAYPNYFADSAMFLEHLEIISKIILKGAGNQPIDDRPSYYNVLARPKI